MKELYQIKSMVKVLMMIFSAMLIRLDPALNTVINRIERQYGTSHEFLSIVLTVTMFVALVHPRLWTNFIALGTWFIFLCGVWLISFQTAVPIHVAFLHSVPWIVLVTLVWTFHKGGGYEALV